MNTKYISSSEVKKSVCYFIECGEKSVCFVSADIFIARDEIYFVFAEKKYFLFLFYSQRKTNFFLGRFSFDLTFALCLLGIMFGSTKPFDKKSQTQNFPQVSLH